MKKRRIVVTISLVAILTVGYLAAQYFANRIALERFDKLITQLPERVQVRYRSAEYGLMSGRTLVSDVALKLPTTGQIRIRRITFTSFDPGRPLPKDFKVEVRGIELRADRAPPATRVWMGRLGYKKIVIDVDFSSQYVSERRLLEIKQLRISGPKIATVAVTAHLGNVQSLMIRDLADPLADRRHVVLRDLRIVYDDRSLFDRYIRARAKAEIKSEADARLAIVTAIDSELKRSKSADLRGDLLHARAFVEKSERIVVRVRPPRPVPIHLIPGMRGLDKIQTVLGVTVRALPGKKRPKD